jgi:hypothetical protein
MGCLVVWVDRLSTSGHRSSGKARWFEGIKLDLAQSSILHGRVRRDQRQPKHSRRCDDGAIKRVTVETLRKFIGFGGD